MITLVQMVNQVLEQLDSWAVANSERGTGLTERSFKSYSRRFAERLLANPSMGEELEVPPETVAKFLERVLGDLQFRFLSAEKLGTIMAILSNPKLVHMAKRAEQLGQLKGGLQMRFNKDNTSTFNTLNVTLVDKLNAYAPPHWGFQKLQNDIENINDIEVSYKDKRTRLTREEGRLLLRLFLQWELHKVNKDIKELEEILNKKRGHKVRTALQQESIATQQDGIAEVSQAYKIMAMVASVGE